MREVTSALHRMGLIFQCLIPPRSIMFCILCMLKNTPLTGNNSKYGCPIRASCICRWDARPGSQMRAVSARPGQQCSVQSPRMVVDETDLLVYFAQVAALATAGMRVMAQGAAAAVGRRMLADLSCRWTRCLGHPFHFASYCALSARRSPTNPWVGLYADSQGASTAKSKFVVSHHGSVNFRVL
jgi:hypothetical protein